MKLPVLVAAGGLLLGQVAPGPTARTRPATLAANPVDLRATPTLAGARLRLTVKHPGADRLVRRFAMLHGRPMHLFVVGEALEFFTHEHPVQQPDGVFMLDVTLPRPGPYMAIAEFLPEGGTPQTVQQAFTTGAAFARVARPALDTAAKVVDGMRISIDASKVKAADTQPLMIRIDDEATGAPVTDLEPDHGASGHLLLIAADMTDAVHAPASELGQGPAVTFRPLIPRAGVYKAWFQFQRAGRVSTVAFVIDVA
jgi:hypothetical protein